MAPRSLLLAAALLLTALPARAGAQRGAPVLASLPRAESHEDKSPLLAGTLGFVIPGLGHLYAGEPGRGALTFLTYLGSAVLIAEGPEGADGVGGLFFLGSWAFGAVDGALAAYRHNRDGERSALSLAGGSARRGAWLGMRLLLQR